MTATEPANEKLEFGQRLAEERKRLGLSQSAMAEACGVKIVSQHHYEKGARTPSIDYLIKAVELGARIERLMPQLFESFVAQLTALYVDVDHQCRSEDGRLLDLEVRASTFAKALIKASKDAE